METILRNFQKKEFLAVTNPLYVQILDELFYFLTKNDHVDDDSTVAAFLPNDIAATVKIGVISAKEDCVIAGLEEVAYLIKKHTALSPLLYGKDGERVLAGTRVLSFEGSIKDILAYERVFLNILQRMSGIASETRMYVSKISELDLVNPPIIAATRKTPWMHIDKKAVAVGGGVTHRLDLRDGILLKDNHLELLSQQFLLQSEADAIFYAIDHAQINTKDIAIEVEIKTDEAVFAAIKAYEKRSFTNPFIILLDNFTPDRVLKIVQEVKRSSKNISFEASGGVNLKNIIEFAKTGVDIISVGVLTHSPKAADLSLDIIN